MKASLLKPLLILSACGVALSGCGETGACISFFGGCADGIDASDCEEPNQFHPGATCDEVDVKGACIDFAGGCLDGVPASECSEADTFHPASTCDEVDVTGACISTVFGGCSDDIPNSECLSTGWHFAYIPDLEPDPEKIWVIHVSELDTRDLLIWKLSERNE